MWSDNETTEDLLGFNVHSQLIAEVINDPELLPITVGVFGDWGSGKSSILKTLSESLKDEENGTFVLYFNGWLFEGYDDAKAALLESIIHEFEINKKFGDEVKGKAKKLLKSVNWMRVLGLGFKQIAVPAATAYMTGGISLIPYLTHKLSSIDPDKIAEEFKAGNHDEFLKSLVKDMPEEDNSMLVREFRSDFKDLIEASEIEKLIVIIDDLDRCTPDRIIENLEAIKLFLNVEKTAFVIGADPRIVKHAIDYRFKVKEENPLSNNRIVEDYLEKLIQVPYMLPKLSDSEVETYISLLICKRDLSNDSYDKVLQEFQKYRATNRYSAFGLTNLEGIVAENEYNLLTNSLSSIPALAPVITQGLYGNPRQIKRFLNTYMLRNKLAKIAGMETFNEAILAKLMILEYTELALFKVLYDWQSVQDGVPKEVTELEEAVTSDPEQIQSQLEAIGHVNWSKSKVITWLKVEPQLSTIDLRDYFWISRDNVSSTISGASLILPIVKTVYSKLNQEGIPVGVSKKLVRDHVKTLNDLERNQFLEYAVKMQLKNQEGIQGYKIFHYMIEENVEGAVDSYKFLLNQVNRVKIPAAIGTELTEFKANPELGEFLSDFFSNQTTMAAKAFNL